MLDAAPALTTIVVFDSDMHYDDWIQQGHVATIGLNPALTRMRIHASLRQLQVLTTMAQEQLAADVAGRLVFVELYDHRLR